MKHIFQYSWLFAIAVGLVVAGCTATDSDPTTDSAAVRQDVNHACHTLDSQTLIDRLQASSENWASA